MPRTERYNWTAPFVATHAGRRQIVLNGETTRGYDYDTGAVIWEAAASARTRCRRWSSTTISSSP